MPAHEITLALARVENNEPGAQEELWELVYKELKQLAASQVSRLKAGQTLQATALVHEAWMRLDASGGDGGWDGRAHFFGAAARSMRNILVDQARSKQRLRRNAGKRAEALEGDVVADESMPVVDMLALDEALTALAEEYERPARIVNLRYFTGLDMDEIARMLDVTSRTVQRDFLFARTWLRRHLDRA
ncbi:MAG: sigma-70 family RNA polymerase sigma factor [Planctomycetes bacterium]|nr:sigma-70 family RNA polymerase sigma factor [Planctomycetota bacterium]